MTHETEGAAMTQAKVTMTHRWDPDQFAQVKELAGNTARPVQHVLDAAVAIGLRRLRAEYYTMAPLTREFAALVYRDQMVSNQDAFADRASHKAAGEWLKARELETAAVNAWTEVRMVLKHRRHDDEGYIEPVASHDWGSNRDDFFALAGHRILVVNTYGEVYGWQLKPEDEVPEIAGYTESLDDAGDAE